VVVGEEWALERFSLVAIVGGKIYHMMMVIVMVMVMERGIMIHIMI